jgi:hypothetical protein
LFESTSLPYYGLLQRRGPQPLGLALWKWRQLWCFAVAATVSLGLAAPARGQTPLAQQATEATWVGGTGTNQRNNSKNWNSALRMGMGMVAMIEGDEAKYGGLAGAGVVKCPEARSSPRRLRQRRQRAPTIGVQRVDYLGFA